MQNNKAFTLIELLIVVAIIGILAAIAVPNFLNAQLRAKIARVESEFRSINTAFEMYRLDNGTIPDWTNGVGWFQAWQSLTTPIAYFSSNPFDVFQPKQQDLFVNGHRFYEFNGVSRGTPIKNVARGTPADNWVIVSLGPDQDDDTIQISDYPKSQIFLSFALTNGLNSNGDIMKETSEGLNPERLP